MNEYLSKEYIRNIVQKHWDDSCGAECYAYSIVLDDIDEAPVSDVAEVKYGYWIYTDPYMASSGKYRKGKTCSYCNAYFVSDGNVPHEVHPYCCKCGAKMIQED